MFFNLPPLTIGPEGERAEIRLLSSRQTDDGKTTNVDIINVRTNYDGEEKITHFGLQGRSDHLASLLEGEKSSDKEAGATA